MAIVYFMMGILFTFIAIQSAGDSGWSMMTILLALIAALDFGVGIRFVKTRFSSNRNKR
ncbi:YdiK family protein [Virgibacillus sp. W0181]|uniref:YdiK family protein n=1 Tax=Virgibacillus sp. W0181 TaxID=3391581 RepID=UPI003F44DD1B